MQAHRREGREGTSFYHVDAAGILAHPYVARSAPQTIEQLRRTMLADRRIRMIADELGQTPLLKTLLPKRPAPMLSLLTWKTEAVNRP